ncbi:MAG: ADP-ribosylglycohydrolase family protein [Bryobacterales bacterium]|nr:ADP-ribosylglycohydrolase family protein [Bryobacterales bacterium]
MTHADAIAGCLIGTAVGDAMGLPYEGLPPAPHRQLDCPRWLPFGLGGMISDDTEHAFMTGHALLAAQGDPALFERAFATELRWWFAAAPPALGWGTLRACVKLCLGFPPARSGVWSAGNAPAMRAPLVGVLYQADLPRLIAMTRTLTRLTHRDPRAEQAARAVALAARLACLPGTIDAARFQMEITEHLECAELRGLLASAQWPVDSPRGVSGYCYETVPAALHCWRQHPDNPRAALTMAIRAGGDTDTVGAIAGALAGARSGPEAFPMDWRNGVKDWPVGLPALRRLAEDLAANRRVSAAGIRPDRLLPLRMLRNFGFFAVAAAHAVRGA